MSEQRHEGDTAERALRTRVDDGGGLAERMALAELLIAGARAGEADDVLADAAAAAATRDERRRMVALRVLWRHFRSPSVEPIEPLLSEAAAVLDAGEEDRDGLVDVLLGAARIYEGRVVEGLPLAEAVLAPDVADPPDATLAVAVWAVGTAWALSGRSERLAELVGRGIAAAERMPELTRFRLDLAYLEILDADLRGRPDLAHRRVRWAARVASPDDAPRASALLQGRMAISAGLPRAAITAFRRALAAESGEVREGSWATLLRAMEAQCLGSLGEGAAAAVALRDAERTRDSRMAVLDFEIDLARAWTAAATGDTNGAVAHCRAGAQQCRRRGVHGAEVLLLQTSVRLGDQDQLARLTQLDRMLDSPRANLAAAHAAAMATHDDERLLVVSAALEDAGMGLEAADAAAQALSFARTRRRPAVTAAAEARVDTLRATSEDARTPALLAWTSGR